MEVFSLLKYWRTTSGSPTETNLHSTPPNTNTNTNTNPTTTIRHVADDDDNDDGLFFDLEFTVPADDVGEQECVASESEIEGEGEENESMDFTVDSSDSIGTTQSLKLLLCPTSRIFSLQQVASQIGSLSIVLSAYDVLGSYGFPVGLLPQGITWYEIDQSGKFTAYLKGSCNVHIAGRHLKYKSTITGNISNDKLTDLVGVSVKVLLFWIGIDKVTVTVLPFYPE
ncbi:hypothetical protein IFM89_027256 [Coptis chinensis]|uniref:Uncharacterized protein n=1 Tax=Coptis chinensis TaxID=261450 RepID=A0A835HHQ9_9MAGN|nr:hypothetical protein IFM89_027256 [Coptis chinensis]